jgi:hypothetical protein
MKTNDPFYIIRNELAGAYKTTNGFTKDWWMASRHKTRADAEQTARQFDTVVSSYSACSPTDLD